tara:strand:+ start:536 stop:763 length:228 start_codon:yes stop_codon:yes gene_type:complete
MTNITSKRFVVRKSLIGQDVTINVNFKNGKTVTYNHDKVYSIMREKLEAMNCWAKYKSYTATNNLPTILRDKEIA